MRCASGNESFQRRVGSRIRCPTCCEHNLIDRQLHASEGDDGFAPVQTSPNLAHVVEAQHLTCSKTLVEIRGHRTDASGLDGLSAFARVDDGLERIKMIRHEPPSVNIEVGNSTATSANQCNLCATAMSLQRDLGRALSSADDCDSLTGTDCVKIQFVGVDYRASAGNSGRTPSHRRVARPHDLTCADGFAAVRGRQPVGGTLFDLRDASGVNDPLKPAVGDEILAERAELDG